MEWVMKTTKLRHVVAVDRHGSITAAATALGVTQSAVTKSVAEIERDLGYALFDRRARDVVATDAGREFINRIARIISDLEQLENDVKSARETQESLLRIGICPPSIQGLFNGAIKQFLMKEKKLRLHIAAMTVERGIHSLRVGDIDLLLSPENSIKSETDFKYHSVGTLYARFFFRKKHPLTMKKNITIKDLSQFPIISPDRLNHYAQRLHDLLTQTDSGASRQLHIIEYFPLIADIVGGTDAIGVISTEYAASKAFQRRFTLLEVNFFDPLPIGLAYRKRWLPNQTMRSFQSTMESFSPFKF